MARLSFIALLTLALSGIVHALPPAQQEILDRPVHNSASWSYTDCGLPTDVIEVRSLTVSPDPPVPGKELTVKASGLVKETIEDGAYATVVVKLGLIKILTKDFDICEEAKTANATIQCPVKNGVYEVEQTVPLPKEIPPAKFRVNVQAFTKDDDAMLCLDLFVDFTKGFPHRIGF